MNQDERECDTVYRCIEIRNTMKPMQCIYIHKYIYICIYVIAYILYIYMCEDVCVSVYIYICVCVFIFLLMLGHGLKMMKIEIGMATPQDVTSVFFRNFKS